MADVTGVYVVVYDDSKVEFFTTERDALAKAKTLNCHWEITQIDVPRDPVELVKWMNSTWHLVDREVLH